MVSYTLQFVLFYYVTRLEQYNNVGAMYTISCEGSITVHSFVYTW